MNFIKTLIMHCITGIDGVTIDPARVYWGLTILTFLGGAITTIVYTHGLDFLAFGGGAAAILFGGGLGVGAKSKTEPQQ